MRRRRIDPNTVTPSLRQVRINAGKQIYRVTRELQRALEAARGRLGDMPRVIVFHSLVDATVKTTDVVQGLLA